MHPKLGWHTDGLRDLFYLRMPKQMLNVGLHFDRVTAKDGGLRLLPGTHTQGFFSMCFRKRYFVDHSPDPEEIAIETEPGDLTVHDGRLWHRVQLSPYTGVTQPAAHDVRSVSHRCLPAQGRSQPDAALSPAGRLDRAQLKRRTCVTTADTVDNISAHEAVVGGPVGGGGDRLWG